MIAYKCDRCGGYFDHKGKILISERVEDPHYSSTNDYRLCPSCEKVLLSWLHNKNSKELIDKLVK